LLLEGPRPRIQRVTSASNRKTPVRQYPCEELPAWK
jgi:hypothetical protein